MSEGAVLQNPRDVQLPCSLSEWLCSVQPQGAASHFDYDVKGSPEHKHTRACLWVCLYVSISVYTCVSVWVYETGLTPL